MFMRFFDAPYVVGVDESKAIDVECSAGSVVFNPQPPTHPTLTAGRTPTEQSGPRTMAGFWEL